MAEQKLVKQKKGTKKCFQEAEAMWWNQGMKTCAAAVISSKKQGPVKETLIGSAEAWFSSCVQCRTPKGFAQG